MSGLVTRFRAAAFVVVAVGLTVLLGAAAWPAPGRGAESSTSETETDADTVEFDGRLHANPETGCVELPPDSWSPPEVVPVGPTEAPDGDGEIAEHADERLRGPRVPPLPGDVDMHAEPWPACDEPDTATPVRDDRRNAEG